MISKTAENLFNCDELQRKVFFLLAAENEELFNSLCEVAKTEHFTSASNTLSAIQAEFKINGKVSAVKLYRTLTNSDIKSALNYVTQNCS